MTLWKRRFNAPWPSGISLGGGGVGAFTYNFVAGSTSGRYAISTDPPSGLFPALGNGVDRFAVGTVFTGLTLSQTSSGRYAVVS
jgi:hypothetical protein